MALLKILAIFAGIMVIMLLKLPLFLGLIAGGVITVLLFPAPLQGIFSALVGSVFSMETLLLVLAVYLVFYLQGMMNARGKTGLIEGALNTLFNNRRVNASLAPACLGVLPAGAIVYTCGDIVKKATDGYLDKHEQAFVTSFHRHVPESFLPTFANIMMALNLSGVAVGPFVLAMLPAVAMLFILGQVFYLRKVPKDTGTAPGGSKGKSLLQLGRGLWMLGLVLVLVLVFNIHVAWASLIGVAVFALVGRFKPKELASFLLPAFDWKIMLNVVAVMAFRGVLENSGALDEMMAFLNGTPIQPWIAFALLFFLGTVVAGSQAITALGIPLAFTALPAGGFPLLVLLLSFAYAAMQISPTHVCLIMATEYFGSDYTSLIKKTLPVIFTFCLFIVAYYLLLNLVF